MAAPKYTVIRNDDIRTALSSEWQQAVGRVLDTIRQQRERSGMSTHEQFFVLAMTDRFAQEAIEAYIAAIQREIAEYEDLARPVPENLTAAMRAAQRVRAQGLMTLEQRDPT